MSNNGTANLGTFGESTSPASLLLSVANAAVGQKSDGFVMLASSGPAIAGTSYTGSRSYPVPWSLVGGPGLAVPSPPCPDTQRH